MICLEYRHPVEYKGVDVEVCPGWRKRIQAWSPLRQVKVLFILSRTRSPIRYIPTSILRETSYDMQTL